MDDEPRFYNAASESRYCASLYDLIAALQSLTESGMVREALTASLADGPRRRGLYAAFHKLTAKTQR